MLEREASEEIPTQLELDVIRTFGWGLIVLEETMFQRYRQLSSRSSLMTWNDFRTLLHSMESKGYISSTNLHGKRAYRRLMIDAEIGVSIHPRFPLDEMRLVVGSLNARVKGKKKKLGKITPKLISDSQSTSEQIIEELEGCMREESSIRRKAAVHQHIKKMLDALSESQNSLFEYIRTELPECLECIGKVLQSHGSEYLMLTLRLAEPQVRRYRLG